MASHALLETARDALFLARLPPARLAWVYLAIALVSLVLFALQERSGLRSGRAVLAAWLVGSAGVGTVLWVLTALPATWTLYVLYTWSGVFASLVVVRFWTLLGELFHVGQAKRLFSLIGAGGVGGAIAGSLLARALAEYAEPRHLLLASSAMLVVTALGTHLLLPVSTPNRPAGTRVEGFDPRWPLQAIWLRPYLRRVAGIVLVSAVALTLVDFIFKSIVVARIRPDELAAFFASTYLVLNALSLATQLFAVSWLIRRLSVNRVLSVLPALVVAATTAVVLGGGLIAALALKGFDGVFRYSLHRTALEVLYVPLTGDLRSRVKGFIDVLGQRGGQAVASVLILIAAALTQSLVAIGVGVIVLAVVWIRIAATLESHYLDLFRETLSAVTSRTRVDFPDLDLASLETLLTRLNSADESEVVAALDMFAEQQRVHLIPALILYHPSRAVVLRALELFSLAGRQDYLAILGLLLDHTDPEVRAAALRTHTWAFGPRKELYLRMANDPSPIVTAAALVGLVSYVGGEAATGAQQVIDELAESGSDIQRLALAHAIRYSPGAIYSDVLLRLAETPDIDCRIAVAQAMREILSAQFIPALVSMLPVRALRNEARATLVAIGTVALTQLDTILGDPQADWDVRLHAPRAIAFFPPRAASTVLMRHLETTDDPTLAYRILRALGRCRRMDPALPLADDILARNLEKTLADAFRFLDERLALERGATDDETHRTPVHGLLVDLLRSRHTLATERLFRLVGLLFPKEDARSLYRGMNDPSPKVRDSSRELLEHLLEPPLQGAVLALVDDIGDDARLARAHPYYQRPGLTYVDTLGDMLEMGGYGTVELVATHIGEIGADGLTARLEAHRTSPSSGVVDGVERALSRLAQLEVTADGS